MRRCYTLMAIPLSSIIEEGKVRLLKGFGASHPAIARLVLID